ncbi:MAG: M23 family metallopeptidase [Ignavibacteriales bacterium]|nr:M23 family metallopeptidase [Ignavibacteriales bacterium]
MQTKILIGKVYGVFKGINFKQLKSLISRFSFSVTIVPEGTSLIRAKTFSFWKVVLFTYIFGTICAIITGVLMVYTPANYYFFNQSYQLSYYQVNELKKLDGQIKYLLKEVDRLQENNKNLRNAIILGDSSALQPFINTPMPKQKYDKNPKEGSIFNLPLVSMFNNFIDFIGLSTLPQAEKTKITMEFRRPCDGFVSNHFHPEEGHYGIDFSLSNCSPVFAVNNGYVVFAGYTADDGNMVIVNHGNGFVSVYKHCQQLLKKMRQRVVQGETIALSGGTGRLAGGSHLHFELWRDGTCLDPEKFVFDK